MKKKIIWLTLGCLVVSALLVSSCAPAAAPAPTPLPAPTPAPAPVPEKKEVVIDKKEMVRDSLGRLVEKPKYGGELVFAVGQDTTGFDETGGTYTITMHSLHLTHDELLMGDWAQGPSGTGKHGMASHAMPDPKGWAPRLAESWEMPDSQTLVFHIRKGVRFALDSKSEASRLVAGREVTADDVVYSVRRNIETRGAYLNTIFLPEEKPTSVTARDKWTVVIKAQPYVTIKLLDGVGDQTAIIPREVIEKYGNMRDWRVTVGSGPYMLADHVPHSSITLNRNPNYWMKDPFHAQNTLPYLDRVKILVIGDVSTRLAALRTGKVDRLSGLSWEDFGSLQKTTPDLKWRKVLYYNPGVALHLRVDTKPLDDVRVRRALNMAVDRPAVAKEFYGGNAEILAFPVAPYPEFMDTYTPLEKLPQEVRELFEYYPEKAKQLLSEAGYPKGFKVTVNCYQEQVDLLSVVKAYWEKVGVELTLEIREYAVWLMFGRTLKHKYMSTGALSAAQPEKLLYATPNTQTNLGNINDPRVNEAIKAMAEASFDIPKRNQILREIVPYYLAQAYHVALPFPYYYCLWWPWLKGYSGEVEPGRMNSHSWATFVWIDRELKEQMTGRK